MPDPVVIRTPSATQQFTSGSPVAISWDPVAGAAYYDIYFLDAGGSGNWLFHTVTNSTSVTTPAIEFTGVATLQVKALATMAVGTRGSYVTPVSQNTVRPTFVH
jgi:hypothetical protein